MHYKLEDQVGFILRLASQRHAGIFANYINDDLTSTQFAAMVKLWEQGSCSQNKLGRNTAMDAATIKGVVGRLNKRGYVSVQKDPNDIRRLLVELTLDGKIVIQKAINAATKITQETLNPLSTKERMQLVSLLKKIT